MDWLLAVLAIFNLVSMVTVFSPRAVPRRSAPWVLFGTALLATELAWIWLPLQVLLACIFINAGALDSGLGLVSLLVLLGTWPGLAWSIKQSTLAEATVEAALRAGLGENWQLHYSNSFFLANTFEAGVGLTHELVLSYQMGWD